MAPTGRANRGAFGRATASRAARRTVDSGRAGARHRARSAARGRGETDFRLPGIGASRAAAGLVAARPNRFGARAGFGGCSARSGSADAADCPGGRRGAVGVARAARRSGLPHAARPRLRRVPGIGAVEFGGPNARRRRDVGLLAGRTRRLSGLLRAGHRAGRDPPTPRPRTEIAPGQIRFSPDLGSLRHDFADRQRRVAATAKVDPRPAGASD